ncbi:MAG: hypothetical protein AB1816_04720 [Bacillota bacterium]
MSVPVTVPVKPDELVMWMLAHSGQGSIRSDPNIVHRAIRDLKEEFPDLLSEFDFFPGRLFPFSQLLARVLFRAELSGLLGTLNPFFDEQPIQPEVAARVREFLNRRIDASVRERLNLLTKRFDEECRRLASGQ